MTENLSPTKIQEEHTSNILLLLAILVLMLHLFAISWFRQPPVKKYAKSPQPFKLEVSMLSIPSPKSSTTLVASPQSKTSPKKPTDALAKTPKEADREHSLKSPTTPPKGHAQKNKPIQQKSQEEDLEATNSPPKQQVLKSQSTLQTRQTVSSAMIQNPARQTHAKDNFIADELHNPSPDYPEMAIFLGYQGNTFVRIHVSAKGVSEGVEILKSSGHKILDESAAKALKNWRFIPSKYGETAIAGSVIISVVFTLH